MISYRCEGKGFAMAAKIIKFYKPDNDKKRLHNVHIIHKLEVQKVLIANWKKMYGDEFVEVVNG